MSIRNIKITVGNQIVGYGRTWTYPNNDGKIYKIPIYQVFVDGIDDNQKANNSVFSAYRFGVTRKTKDSPPTIVGLSDHQTHTIKAWLPKYTVHSYGYGDPREYGAWIVYDSFLIHDGPDNPLTQVYATIGCVEICYGPRGFEMFNDTLISLSGSKQPTRDKKLVEIGNSRKVIITYRKAERPPLVLF